MSLIIVGGIPCSGKTTICNIVQGVDPSYTHIEMDRLFDDVAGCGELFFRYLSKHDPRLATDIKVDMVMKGLVDPDEQLKTFGAAVLTRDVKKTESFIQDLSIHYLCDVVKEAYAAGKNPLIEGSFVNTKSRKYIYEKLRQEVSGLDAVKKALVFMDYGLKFSMKNLKKGRTQRFESLETTPNTIRSQFDKQQLPTNSELPNLECVIVKDTKKLKGYIGNIMGYVR